MKGIRHREKFSAKCVTNEKERVRNEIEKTMSACGFRCVGGVGHGGDGLDFLRRNKSACKFFTANQFFYQHQPAQQFQYVELKQRIQQA